MQKSGKYFMEMRTEDFLTSALSIKRSQAAMPGGAGLFINVQVDYALYMIFTKSPEPLTKSRFDSIVLDVFIHID
jgi:hypothetical protein